MDSQADMSFRWGHMLVGLFSHVLAHFICSCFIITRDHYYHHYNIPMWNKVVG